MDLNLQAWPALLLQFGPYAILALFLLWVIPRSWKRLQELPDTAPSGVRRSAIIAVWASWGVALVMVGYVVFTWSPIRVYQGQLGVQSKGAQIYPVGDNLYVKAQATQAPGRQLWRFALVGHEGNLTKNRDADFFFCWGSGQHDCADYLVPIKSIIGGHVSNFPLSKKDSDGVYRWNKGQWKVASRVTGGKNRYAFDFGWNAYADTKKAAYLKKIGDMLASANRLMRAEGRKKLRALSDGQIKTLKRMTTDPEALRQIELEQKRRKR